MHDYPPPILSVLHREIRTVRLVNNLLLVCLHLQRQLYLFQLLFYLDYLKHIAGDHIAHFGYLF